MNTERKYTAIKLTGLNTWIWFETIKIHRENGTFIGEEGWGKGGEFTNIKVDEKDITSEIYSDGIFYI